MKRFLLGGAALLISAGIVNAADLPAKAPNVYRAAPAYSWGGFYAGVHGGYGWGENTFSDDATGVSGKYEPSGGFGGLQIGYNRQFSPHWLIGGEFDFSAGDLSDSGSFTGGTGRYKIDYFGTARTRFGYVVDRSLLFVTGGVAWMHDKSNNTGGAVTSTDQYSVGWVIGGGWEWAIDNRWSAKIEYLYASFDKTRDFNGAGNRRTFDADVSTVKAGLNYRFGDMFAASYMPTKAVAPRSTWAGGYLGLHGGYGWGDFDTFNGAFAPVDIAHLKPDGGFGGFQSGANWMVSPNWLFGLETDASYGSLKDSGQSSVPNPVSVKVDALGTLRARFGYVAGDTLVYVTGGGAYAHAKSSLTFIGNRFESKENYFGWALGGGVEYKFAPEWSAKLEYMYMDLGKNHFDTTDLGQPRNTELTMNTVKVGINYSGPLIERFFGGR
jgi:outer membrane immunogenic protein